MTVASRDAACATVPAGVGDDRGRVDPGGERGALHYRAAPGLRFPATERPNLLDFAYFAFTVGTSFATSDVEVQARPIRYTVLTHSVVSFVYNTAILGIAVGVITGK
ncbi:DUF1345 domain-containing protein [Amycolatopsis sp. H6(2020)]|nr:DUF1345 domain-containing protein [Amycolatopsis sp. H6(2020)]